MILFKIFTRHSMMITIIQGNKQWHIQHQSHIWETQRQIFSRGNPYRVKTSSSLDDKYYLHSLHYHTYEHQLIVRLKPLFCKLQLAERTNSLCSRSHLNLWGHQSSLAPPNHPGFWIWNTKIYYNDMCSITS